MIKRIWAEQSPFLLGIPALLWQFIFFYTPLIFIVLLSFSSLSGEYFVHFFSWTYASVFIRSLALSCATTLICLLCAYPVAYWLAFRAGRWRNFCMFFLFIPFWTNFLLHIYAWMFVLDRQGVLNTLLQQFGLVEHPLHLLNSTWAVLLVMIYCYLPFMILPLYTSLEKFDTRLEEASSDLGATRWQTLWRIILPLSLPGVRSGIIMVLVPATGEFIIPELIGGDKVMYVGSVIAHYTLHAETVPLGMAFTLLVSVVLLSVVYGVYLFIRRMMTYAG